MAPKAKSNEPRLPTRDSFSNIHIAYASTDLRTLTLDVRAIFAETHNVEQSLLDEAILDYFIVLIRECQLAHMSFSKTYFIFNMARIVLSEHANPTMDSAQLTRIVINKISNLLTESPGFCYTFDALSCPDFDTIDEPFVLDEHHAPLIYRDALAAAECYSSLTGTNQKGPAADSGKKPTQPKPKTPVDAPQYMFTLTESEALTCTKVLRYLLNSVALWKACFRYTRAKLIEHSVVVGPHDPTAAALPPLKDAYPHQTLGPLECAIIKAARPKAAVLYNNLKKEIAEAFRQPSALPQ